MSAVIHVVAAVIRDQNNKILIAKRPDDKHQGGKWEFPGGKVEAGELAEQALVRELDEELGITAADCQPLIKIRHDYIDKSILLDVWELKHFTGIAHGKEGQAIKWVELSELSQYEFPEANVPIITAIELPDTCLITPEPRHEKNFLEKLDATLDQGIRLVQFRAKELSNADYMDLARSAIQLVHQYDGKILLNSPPLWIAEADGMHLSSQILEHTPFRPSLGIGKWVTTACHNLVEIEKAKHIRVDAVFISPVNKTSSHPMAEPIGWDGFKTLVDEINVPAYALGGLSNEDIHKAKENSAQGVAAISSIWNKKTSS